MTDACASHRWVFALDEDGWVKQAARIESPNRDCRPRDCAVELIVIHGISLPPGCFGGPDVARLFMNTLCYEDDPYFEHLRGLRVSSHFLIRRDGALLQFVSCRERAWHAGVSNWNGRTGCNDFSIGIELEGTDDVPYEDDQYRACRGLIAAIRRSYPITAVVGHSDIAPGRKTDPGPFFDWSKLATRSR